MKRSLADNKHQPHPQSETLHRTKTQPTKLMLNWLYFKQVNSVNVYYLDAPTQYTKHVFVSCGLQMFIAILFLSCTIYDKPK